MRFSVAQATALLVLLTTVHGLNINRFIESGDIAIRAEDKFPGGEGGFSGGFGGHRGEHDQLYTSFMSYHDGHRGGHSHDNHRGGHHDSHGSEKVPQPGVYRRTFQMMEASEVVVVLVKVALAEEETMTGFREGSEGSDMEITSVATVAPKSRKTSSLEASEALVGTEADTTTTIVDMEVASVGTKTTTGAASFPFLARSEEVVG
ncbi:hypothetical protein BT96DRAFT_940996 [Gymnopus androsaceus JB14]|uniref:Uncharacterized protein n=1 Tax=Gymnopus androsaceus JB14 TaxID=1447944 RepID=A0A6A4HH99_9AGAR|nr:hypothetical protein BT96DRAFT_940996 [Gymnopus androsaceus JB14]